MNLKELLVYNGSKFTFLKSRFGFTFVKNGVEFISTL
jgi:hypothetical protein